MEVRKLCNVVRVRVMCQTFILVRAMKNVPVTVLKILSEFPPQIFILLLGLLHCSNDTNIYFHAPIVSLFRSSFMVHHPSLLFLVQIFVQIKRQSITGNLFGRGNPILCRDLYWSVWSFCEIRGRPNRKLVLMWFSASIQVLHSVQLHHSFCSVMLCPTSFSRSICHKCLRFEENERLRNEKNFFDRTLLEDFFVCQTERPCPSLFRINYLWKNRTPRDNLEFVFVINKI